MATVDAPPPEVLTVPDVPMPDAIVSHTDEESLRSSPPARVDVSMNAFGAKDASRTDEQSPRRSPPPPVDVSMVVFGANDCAQLGCGRDAGEAVGEPMLVEARNVDSVCFGACHSAWLTADGEVFAVGANDHGQCGLGAHIDELAEPKLLEAFSTKPVVQLSAGESHSAAVTREGELITWGESSHGQCGHGAGTDVDVRKPRVVQSLRASSVVVSSVSCGGQFTAVVSTMAEVFTCGMGRFGALGHGDLADRAAPARVLDLLGVPVRAVAAGERHCVALTYNGEAISWGWGAHGQLGIAEPLHFVSQRADGRAPETASAGSASERAAAAAERDHAQPTPRVITALKGKHVSAVACGGAHTLLLLSEQPHTLAQPQQQPQQQMQLVACGRNAQGQLGTGDFGDRRTPAAVALPAGALGIAVGGIAAGSEHSALWLESGAVFVWGGGRFGELGCLPLPAPPTSLSSTDQPQPHLCTPAELRLPQLAGRVARRVVVCAGAHSTAVIAAERERAALVTSPPEACFASAAEVEALAKAAIAPAELEQLSRRAAAVFGSPALLNASFAQPDSAADASAGGSVRGSELERAYVALIQTHSRSPALLLALRTSVGEAIARLEELLARAAVRGAAGAGAGASGSGAGGGGASSGAAAGSGSARGEGSSGGGGKAAASELAAGSMALSKARPGPPALPASASSGVRPLSRQLSLSAHVTNALPTAQAACRTLVALLQSPLMSDSRLTADELPRIGRLVRALDAAGLRELVDALRALEPALFGARIVRALRGRFEETLQAAAGRGLWDENGESRQAHLLALLALAHQANELDEASRGSTRIPRKELASTWVSEHVDLTAQFGAWVQGGIGFNVCNYPFLLTVTAKGQLLKVEAAVRMQTEVARAVQQIYAPLTAAEEGNTSGAPVLVAKSSPPAASASAGGGADAAAEQQPRLPSHFEKINPYFVLEVRRGHLVEDTLRAIASSSVRLLLRPLKVFFVGEPAIDEGGVSKELFQLLLDEIFDADFGMFETSKESRRCWFRAQPGFAEAAELQAEFFLVGLVLGLAVHNGQILDLRFPPALFRMLLNLPVGLAQLADIDPELARGLEQLRTFEGDVEATFCADFTLTETAFGQTRTVELKPGGANIPVTNANREEYVALVAKHKIETSCKSQFGAFQRGFLLMCDGAALSFVTPEELEELVCGEPHLDFKALQANAAYDGFRPDHPFVGWFWEVVHSLSSPEQATLLQFATGSDRAPVGGLGKLRFILQRAGPDSMALPVAHTCFNMLTIPEYTSRAKLRDRLLIAIANAEGFGLQ